MTGQVTAVRPEIYFQVKLQRVLVNAGADFSAIGIEADAAGIEEVAAGGGALSAAAAAALIGRVAEERQADVDPALADLFSALTPKERDVVIAIATGQSNQQIAETMFVSPYTVKTHANRAMTKVGARDRAQLVAYAYRAGLAS